LLLLAPPVEEVGAGQDELVAVGAPFQVPRAGTAVDDGLPGAEPSLLPGAEDSDVGGVHDADEEPGNSGGLMVMVPGLVGEVPG
jgi:hypothetical protein